jgi:hypothetical protein
LSFGYVTEKLLSYGEKNPSQCSEMISGTMIIRGLGRALMGSLALLLYYPLGSKFYDFIMGKSLERMKYSACLIS